MTLEMITEKFQEMAAKAPSIDATLKFKLKGAGIIYIDGNVSPAQVSNEDKEADCTISTSVETLDGLRKGEINPMMAVIGGKVKIDGNMGVAMKLQSLFS